MIEGNVLKFGYGTLEVEDLPDRCGLMFRHFTPALTCGAKVFPQHVTYIGNPVYCYVEPDDYDMFLHSLNRVKSEEIDIFEYNGHVFDFSNAEPISAEMCIKHLDSTHIKYHTY